MCEKCDKTGLVKYVDRVPYSYISIPVEGVEYCTCVEDGLCPNCGYPCEWDEKNECPVTCDICHWNVDNQCFEESTDNETSLAEEEDTDLDAHEKAVLDAMIAYEAETSCAITIDKLAEVMDKVIAEVDWIVNNLVEKNVIIAFDQSERYTKTLYYVNEDNG